MPSICLYFQVHQPFRLNRFSIFADNNGKSLFDIYFNNKLNEEIFLKVAKKCYFPTNSMLLELINKFDGKFKVSYSLTGVFIEQCEKYAPELIESFRRLAETGEVEFLSETYYHSLSSLFHDKREFKEQIELHKNALKKIYARPKIFRNTEALFSNEIAKIAEELGYDGIITEGFEGILGWRSPNYLYKIKGTKRIKALLRNYRLSDDISFRFSASWWNEYPLTADKYALWLSKCEGQCINIFMDYETFGEQQWEETGIFKFLYHLPIEILKCPHLNFKKPMELVKEEAVGEIDVPNPISWADIERDTSAWLGNEMQLACFKELENIEKIVKENGDKEFIHIWRLLQNSDHLYYLCTKSLADGDVHKYFSPYQNPYDGFINYMNIIQDFKSRLL